MEKTTEMVNALETFVIQKVQSFGDHTSPEDISALAELVKAINAIPMPLQYIGEVSTACSVEDSLGKLSKRLDGVEL